MKIKKLAKNYYNLYKNRPKVYPSDLSLKFFKSHNEIKNIKKYKKKILDIGFGDGRDMILFNDLGMDVYGIEIDKKIINEFKKNNHYKFTKNLRVGTNNLSHYENNFFDFIYAATSCSYFENDKISINQIFENINKALKKGGFFLGYIIGHKSTLLENSKKIKKNLFKLKDNKLNLRSNQLYYTYKNKKQLQFDLIKAKFKNIQIYEQNLNWFGRKTQKFIFVSKK